MSTSKKIISLDFSSKNIKVGLVTDQLKLIATSFQPYTLINEDVDGFAKRFSIEEIWDKILLGMKTVLSSSKTDSKELMGISSCAQRMAVVFLDKDGNELYGGPNIDIRGIDSAYLIEDEFTEEELFNITGHLPSILFCLARLLWFKEEEEETYGKINKILMLDDSIIYRLTGTFCTDKTSASESQLFDVQKGEWSSEIIEAFKFENEWFPPIMDSGTIVGELKEEISKKIGLERNHLPVIKSGGDTQATLLGMGAIEEGNIGLSLGTTAPLHLVVDKPILDAECNHWLMHHSIKNKWIIEANAGNTGTVYDWYKDCFLRELTNDPDALIETHLRTMDLTDDSTFAFLGPELMRIKDQTSIKRGVFLFQAPVMVAETFTKLPNFTKAVMDNIGFGILESHQALKKFSSAKIETFCAGGLSHSTEFCKLLANILNTELKVPKIRDSAFIGTAINTLVALDRYKNEREVVDKLIEHERFPINLELADKYQTIYKEWKRLNEKISEF